MTCVHTILTNDIDSNPCCDLVSDNEEEGNNMVKKVKHILCLNGSLALPYIRGLI